MPVGGYGNQYSTPSPNSGMGGYNQTSGAGSGRSTASGGPATTYGAGPPIQHTDSYAGQRQSALNFYAGIYGPEMAQLQNQQAQLGGRIGAINSGYGQQAGALNRGYNADLAGLGLDQRLIDNERGGIGRQIGYYTNVDNIQEQQYLANQALQMQLLGFNADYARTNRAGFDQDVLQRDQSLAQNKFAEQRAREQMMSDLAAGGATVSAGARSDSGALKTELGFANQTTNREFERAKLGFTDKDTGLRSDKAQIENRQKNLLYDRELGKLSNAEQKARLEERGRALDIESERIGVNKEKLAAGLQQGLAALNMQNIASIGQIMDAMNSNNMQQAALARSIFEQALANQSAFPYSANRTATDYLRNGVGVG